jgi:hypothetical protein
VIRVKFEAPLEDALWDKWRRDAERKTTALKRKFCAGEGYDIDEELYKRPRAIFLRAFHEKCAYCETKVTSGQNLGDVEHYRPKGRVMDEHGKPVIIAARGGRPKRQHPGYPWLAYDPDNLLPSCLACNRPGTQLSGLRAGKWDRFPVLRYRAKEPGQEAREKPLLLHPVFDDPEEHMELDLETGRLRGRTQRGRATINILGLNREGLQEDRREVVGHVQAHLVAAKTALDNGDLKAARRSIDQLTRYREGSAPYSWAGRLALDALGPDGH